MPTVRTGFLCNYASQESAGLVSAIGAFVDSVYSQAPPIRALLFVVARVEYSEDELGVPMDLSLALRRESDDEMLIEATGIISADREFGTDPNVIPTSTLILPLAVEFTAPGRHVVRITIGERTVWEAPITAVLLDSAPG
jgi:hypothetical protein